MKIFSNACISLVKNIIDKGVPGCVNYLTNTHETVEELNSETVLLPNVIVWDPLVKNQLVCPHCFENDGSKENLLSSNHWTQCQSNSMYPRTIYDLGWVCIIIGKIYLCSNNHRIISYHAGILKQLSPSTIPFILSHDSGMTLKLFDFILRLIETGSSFNAIQTLLKESMQDELFRRRIRVEQVPLKATESGNKLHSPSINFIITTLIEFHQKYGSLFQLHFLEQSFTSLSLDHTFKVATNIGYMKNKKWIKVYDSILIFLTESGFSKTFMFMKGASLEKASTILADLASENSNLEYIFVDNCCQYRIILNSYFPAAVVLLDIFHAVQRLSKCVSKKHPFYCDFIKEVGLIFRDPSDIGSVRTKPTPNTETILRQFDYFLCKWKDVSFNGWKLLTVKAINEFRKLRVHVQKGCLSGIPTGMGTNRNEALHKFLGQFKRNRLSVECAIAIINLILYNTNCRKKGFGIVPPIWSQYKLPDAESRKQTTNLTAKEREVQSNECHVLEYADFDDFLTSDASKIAFIADVLCKLNQQLPDCVTQKLHRYQGFTTLPMECWSLEEYLNLAQTGENFDPDTIKSLFQNMNLQAKETDGMFISAYLELLQSSSMSPNLPQLLISYIKDILGEEKPLATLKTIFNEELFGPRKLLYCKEIDSCESIDFLHFTQAPLVAVNAFNIPMVIVPSKPGLPMLPIFPIDAFNSFKHILFVFFDGKNFYPLVPLNENNDKIDEKSNSKVKCFCGEKSKSKPGMLNCKNNFRCSCLKASKPCGQECKCRSCGNGKPPKENPAKRRKRTPHEICFKRCSTSLQYLLSMGEKPNENFVTGLEHFTLEALVHFTVIDLAGNNWFFSEEVKVVSEIVYQLLLSLKSEESIFSNMFDIEKDLVKKWVRFRRIKHDLMLQKNKHNI